jgi:hypothetical protein
MIIVDAITVNVAVASIAREFGLPGTETQRPRKPQDAVAPERSGNQVALPDPNRA